MGKRGIPSPDVFDAFCLSFARPQKFYTTTYAQEFFDKKMTMKKLNKHVDKIFKMTNY